MSYDEDEYVDEETSFKISDNDDEVFDDDYDDTLDPADEETGFKFDEEEEPETI